MLNELRGNKNSLYGKVQLRPAVPFGLLVLALFLMFGLNLPDAAVVPAMFANGLLLAGFVPWWGLDPTAPAPARWPRHTLAPRVRLHTNVSTFLLIGALLLGGLGVALDVSGMTIFSGSAVLLLGLYLSQYLPVWRDWRK